MAPVSDWMRHCDLQNAMVKTVKRTKTQAAIKDAGHRARENRKSFRRENKPALLSAQRLRRTKNFQVGAESGIL